MLFETENLASKPQVIGEDYLLVAGVAPVYPASALSHNLECYVDLSFTILAKKRRFEHCSQNGTMLALFNASDCQTNAQTLLEKASNG